MKLSEAERESRRSGGERGAEPTVSIVIPAKNEALNLPHVFSAPAALRGDLGRRTVDDTVRSAAVRPDITVVGQTRKGKGNALACGFAVAQGTSSSCSTRTARPIRPRSPASSKPSTRGRLRQGQPLHARGGLQRHLPAAPGGQLLFEQDREPDLRDPLHRPVLRLQRLPAGVPLGHGPRGRGRQHRSGRHALGRRLRGRDPDQRAHRQGRPGGGRGPELRAQPPLRLFEPQRLLRRDPGAAHHPRRAQARWSALAPQQDSRQGDAPTEWPVLSALTEEAS